MRQAFRSEDGLRRTVLRVLGMLALVLGLASVSSAFTPQFLQLKVTKAQLSTDGTNFTTIPGAAKTFTITDGDPGAVLGELLRDVKVEPKNYTKFKVFISCNLTLQVRFDPGGGEICSLAGGTFGACPAEGPAKVTFTIPDCEDNEVSKTFDISLDLTKGGTPVLTISFDNQAEQQGASVGPPPSSLDVQQ